MMLQALAKGLSLTEKDGAVAAKRVLHLNTPIAVGVYVFIL